MTSPIFYDSNNMQSNWQLNKSPDYWTTYPKKAALNLQNNNNLSFYNKLKNWFTPSNPFVPNINNSENFWNNVNAGNINKLVGVFKQNGIEDVTPQTLLLAQRGDAQQRLNFLNQANYESNGNLFNSLGDPNLKQSGGLFGISAEGWGNLIGGANLALGAYNALQANKQFKFQRDQAAWQKAFAQRNLTNQVEDYNRRLSARVHRAAQWNGESAAQADEYVNKHRLSDKVG